jgi:hypothetical protein
LVTAIPVAKSVAIVATPVTLRLVFVRFVIVPVVPLVLFSVVMVPAVLSKVVMVPAVPVRFVTVPLVLFSVVMVPAVPVRFVIVLLVLLNVTIVPIPVLGTLSASVTVRFDNVASSNVISSTDKSPVIITSP